MYPELSIFEYGFTNEEIQKEFNDFFFKYGLEPLFTNEHQAGSIKVALPFAQSILNVGGANRRLFLELADYLMMAQDNKSFEEAVFRMIYEARTFQGLINKVKKIVNYIRTISVEHLHNTWNIVWYNKDLQ